MAKFSVPAAQMVRPASPALAAEQSAVLKTLADLEVQNQEMKAEYQYLRARVQNMPKANDQSSFGWLAGALASVGLAASVGVAAARKYGQTGLITASASSVRVPSIQMKSEIVLADTATQ